MVPWRPARFAYWLVPFSLLGAAVAARRWLARGLPSIDGTLTVGGLRAPVEIHRDLWGVPHIYARDQADLFFAQGFVHAQDRLWQMELGRRLAQGRLSEVFGKVALEIDRFFRRLGLHRVARASLKLSSDEALEVLESYSRGVNAYLAHANGRWPLEFSLARFEPQPWRPLDSLTLGRYLAWVLSDNWIAEYIRGRFIVQLGLDEATRLEPLVWRDVSPEERAAYAEGAWEQERDGERGRAKGRQAFSLCFSTSPSLSSALPLHLGPGGSNAWVIAGQRSTTGSPLLANDPHLPPSLPATWYEIHLNGGQYHVAGASIPGLPGVVIGHNERIGWGVTSALIDLQDLFVERLRPDEPHAYLYRGRWQRGEVVVETISVRGYRQPLQETVLITHHGPVLTPTPLLSDEPRSLALCSVALQAWPMAESLLALNRAASWQEFRAALAAWQAPPLNFVYADVDGNIGYQLAGRVPVRGEGGGLAPVAGWTGKHDWTGWVDFEELPAVLNPPAGYVATANNDPVFAGCSHQLSREWCAPYRYQRICQVVESAAQLSPNDLRRLHMDLVCLPGREVAAYLGKLRPARLADGAEPSWSDGCPADRADLDWAIETLRAWDGVLGPESVAGALYQAFKLHFFVRRYGQMLGDRLPWLLGQGPHPVIAPTSNYLARVSETLVESLSREGDDQAIRQLAWQALLDALAFLRRHLGTNRERWAWGRLHQLTFRHPMGTRRPLGLLFNVGPIPVGGDADTLCQSASLLPSLQADSWCPSYRQVLDLADWDRSMAVLPTGQSGHRASRHYADQLALWRAGQYHPMPFTRPAVLAQSRACLTLAPAGA